MPISLESQPKTDAGVATKPDKKIHFGRSGISADDRMFMIEQLALMLETGNSLHQALRSMEKNAGNDSQRRLLAALSDDVAAGRSFSAAMAAHPEVFSNTYVSLIAASENGGFMHEVLAELLKMEEKRRELKSTVVSALSYPAFLVVFSFAVVIFVLMVVFPKFAPMFATIHDQLPTTTRVLLSLSEGLQAHWPSALVFVGVLIGALWMWAKSDAGRALLDRWKLSTPAIGPITLQIYSVQILRVLSLSIANGVRVPEALAAAKEVVSNQRVQHFMEHVEQSVQQGAGIARGFTSGNLMPDLVCQMVATGEESGELARVTDRLAAYYEKELAKKLSAVSRMAEPVMLLVMGLIVGTLVSSLILPIFKLSRVVN